MEIYIGDKYRITSDPLNIMLEQKTIGKGEKNMGKVVWVNKGYYPNIETACLALLELRMNTSDARSIGELMQLVKDCSMSIVECVKGGTA